MTHQRPLVPHHVAWPVAHEQASPHTRDAKTIKNPKTPRDMLALPPPTSWVDSEWPRLRASACEGHKGPVVLPPTQDAVALRLGHMAPMLYGQARSFGQIRQVAETFRQLLLEVPELEQVFLWLGDSCAGYVLGARRRQNRPNDIDFTVPLVVAPNKQIESAEILAWARAALTEAIKRQWEIEASVWGRTLDDAFGGKVVHVTLGSFDEHVDLRVVVANTAAFAYDFPCNGLLVDPFDSKRWSAVGQLDPRKAIQDATEGIYRQDHTLSTHSITRAWKMRTLGFVPAMSLTGANGTPPASLLGTLIDYLVRPQNAGASDFPYRFAEFVSQHAIKLRLGEPKPIQAAQLVTLANAVADLSATNPHDNPELPQMLRTLRKILATRLSAMQKVEGDHTQADWSAAQAFITCLSCPNQFASLCIWLAMHAEVSQTPLFCFGKPRGLRVEVQNLDTSAYRIWLAPLEHFIVVALPDDFVATTTLGQKDVDARITRSMQASTSQQALTALLQLPEDLPFSTTATREVSDALQAHTNAMIARFKSGSEPATQLGLAIEATLVGNSLSAPLFDASREYDGSGALDLLRQHLVQKWAQDFLCSEPLDWTDASDVDKMLCDVDARLKNPFVASVSPDLVDRAVRRLIEQLAYLPKDAQALEGATPAQGAASAARKKTMDVQRIVLRWLNTWAPRTLSPLGLDDLVPMMAPVNPVAVAWATATLNGTLDDLCSSKKGQRALVLWLDAPKQTDACRLVVLNALGPHHLKKLSQGTLLCALKNSLATRPSCQASVVLALLEAMITTTHSFRCSLFTNPNLVQRVLDIPGTPAILLKLVPHIATDARKGVEALAKKLADEQPELLQAAIADDAYLPHGWAHTFVDALVTSVIASCEQHDEKLLKTQHAEHVSAKLYQLYQRLDAIQPHEIGHYATCALLRACVEPVAQTLFVAQFRPVEQGACVRAIASLAKNLTRTQLVLAATQTLLVGSQNQDKMPVIHLRLVHTALQIDAQAATPILAQRALTLLSETLEVLFTQQRTNNEVVKATLREIFSMPLPEHLASRRSMRRLAARYCLRLMGCENYKEATWLIAFWHRHNFLNANLNAIADEVGPLISEDTPNLIAAVLSYFEEEQAALSDGAVFASQTFSALATWVASNLKPLHAMDVNGALQPPFQEFPTATYDFLRLLQLRIMCMRRRFILPMGASDVTFRLATQTLSSVSTNMFLQRYLSRIILGAKRPRWLCDTGLAQALNLVIVSDPDTKRRPIAVAWALALLGLEFSGNKVVRHPTSPLRPENVPQVLAILLPSLFLPPMNLTPDDAQAWALKRVQAVAASFMHHIVQLEDPNWNIMVPLTDLVRYAHIHMDANKATQAIALSALKTLSHVQHENKSELFLRLACYFCSLLQSLPSDDALLPRLQQRFDALCKAQHERHFSSHLTLARQHYYIFCRLYNLTVAPGSQLHAALSDLWNIADQNVFTPEIVQWQKNLTREALCRPEARNAIALMIDCLPISGSPSSAAWVRIWMALMILSDKAENKGLTASINHCLDGLISEHGNLYADLFTDLIEAFCDGYYRYETGLDDVLAKCYRVVEMLSQQNKDLPVSLLQQSVKNLGAVITARNALKCMVDDAAATA